MDGPLPVVRLFLLRILAPPTPTAFAGRLSARRNPFHRQRLQQIVYFSLFFHFFGGGLRATSPRKPKRVGDMLGIRR